MISEFSSASGMEERLERSPRRPLPAMIIYDDEFAYRRALHTLTRVVRADRNPLRPRAWQFDTLETVTGRTYAALDLAKAEVFVLSTSTGGRLPSTIELWLVGSFGGLRRTTGTVVALLGQAGQPDSPNTECYQLVRRAALAAGWDFVAPDTSESLATRSVPSRRRAGAAGIADSAD